VAASAHRALHVRMPGRIARGCVSKAAGNHALDRLARFRMLRQGVFLHALLNFKAADGLFWIGSFVYVRRHAQKMRDENEAVNCGSSSVTLRLAGALRYTFTAVPQYSQRT
jgi:hypothetical protein